MCYYKYMYKPEEVRKYYYIGLVEEWSNNEIGQVIY